jgi:REP element-mobilizing transposase RayT
MGQPDTLADAMQYDPSIHHRRSMRLATWDYRDCGAYFVTICTHNRIPLFGRFTGDQLSLNAFGKVAEEEWQVTPDLRSEVALDAFVVMPNHVHGIVWIQRDAVAALAPTTGMRASLLPSSVNPRRRATGVAPGSLSAAVGAYKSAVTRVVNRMRSTPGGAVWQRNYWDRVIRSDQELDRAREYIYDNPRRWSQDKYNPARAIDG